MPKEHMLTEVIISDTHVGSAYGLFPKGFKKSTGEIASLNKGQRYLLKCWQHVLEVLPPKVDILILNGDIINGANPREGAADLTEVDPEWQQRAAIELLTPLAERAKEVWVTQGTSYHVGEMARYEEQLAESLGANPDQWGHYAWDWLLLEIEGINQSISHHQSVFFRYRSSPLEREVQFGAMLQDWKGSDDIIVRSHTHNFLSLNVEGRLAISTPGWQLQSRYVRRGKMPTRQFPRFLGVILLQLYPEKTERGRARKLQNAGEFIEILPLLYTHPPLRRSSYQHSSSSVDIAVTAPPDKSGGF